MLYEAVVEERHSPGVVCYGQEDDAWPNYEDGHFSYKVVGFRRLLDGSRALRQWELPEGDVFWVTVVRYSDGGTFGQTLGYGALEGVFSSKKEADDRAEEIRNGGKSIEGWTAWDGYFARLERVEVYPVGVGE